MYWYWDTGADAGTLLEEGGVFTFESLELYCIHLFQILNFMGFIFIYIYFWNYDWNLLASLSHCMLLVE